MDITATLEEFEIIEAICNYIQIKSPVTVNGELDVNIIAGRGAAGTSAVIKIGSAKEEVEQVRETKPAPKNTPATPKAAGKDVTPKKVEAAETKTKAEEKVAEPAVSDSLKEAAGEPGDNIFAQTETADDADLNALFGS